MRVESFKTGKGLTRYVLVGSSGAPLEPVLHFLRFKDYCGMARNTLKAYCYHLKLYFDYLEAVGTAFEDVGIDELAGFLRWMQSGGSRGNDVPISGTPTRSAQTINVYMSTVYAFYDYLARHEEYSLRLSDRLTRSMPASKRGFKDFLHHINKSKQYKEWVIKLKNTAFPLRYLQGKSRLAYRYQRHQAVLHYVQQNTQHRQGADPYTRNADRPQLENLRIRKREVPYRPATI